jgi:ribulose-bisphosphate carboxylase large chain
MVLIGAGAFEHPGGSEAGARSLRQAVDAVVAGTPVDVAAKAAPELAVALQSRWSD